MKSRFPDKNAPSASPAASVAGYSRAARSVRVLKAWAGLAGFVLAGYSGLSADIPTEQALLRALAGGVVAYLAAWTIGVLVWRQLLTASVEVARERRREQIEAMRAAAAQRQSAEPPRNG
jgi:hypothetical protein